MGVVIPDKVIMNAVSERLLGSLVSCSVVWLVSQATATDDDDNIVLRGKCNRVAAEEEATRCKDACLTLPRRIQPVEP